MARKTTHAISYFFTDVLAASALLRPTHPSWAFICSVCGVIAGIILGYLLQQTVFRAIFWPLAALLLLLIIFFHCNPLACLLALCSGFVVGSFLQTPYTLARQTVCALAGQTVTISGQISAAPSQSSGATAVQLSNLTLQLPAASDAEPATAAAAEDSSDSADLPLAGTLYVKLSSRPDLQRSDSLTLRGTLQSGFGTYLASFSRPEILSAARPPSGDPFAEFKDFFAGLVRSYLPATEASLGLSYLLGDKSDLSAEFIELLRAVGMTHVVVASGAHLAIITNLAKKLFGRISRFASTAAAVLVIFAFASVVGFTPSMTRAALVALLGLIFGYYGRKFAPLRLILLVAALTLAIAPLNFLNLGWQLSFASFFGILVLAPRLTRALYGGKQPPWLASMLLTSLATTLLCVPILIYNFGSLSLLSFVANLIILPTLPYAMLLVFLTGATAFCSPIATFIAQLATWLLDLHIWVVNFLSDKTAFILQLPSGDPRIFLLYLPIFAPLLLALRRARRPAAPLALSTPEALSP